MFLCFPFCFLLVLGANLHAPWRENVALWSITSRRWIFRQIKVCRLITTFKREHKKAKQNWIVLPLLWTPLVCVCMCVWQCAGSLYELHDWGGKTIWPRSKSLSEMINTSVWRIGVIHLPVCVCVCVLDRPKPELWPQEYNTDGFCLTDVALL